MADLATRSGIPGPAVGPINTLADRPRNHWRRQVVPGSNRTARAVALLVLSLCAYLPLRAYSQGLDNRAADRLLSSGRDLDDYEKDLVRHSLDRTRWILGTAFVGWILYQMPAVHFGWWHPKTPEQWTLVLFGAA